MEFTVEFSVYDGPGKRVRLAIFGALVAGMVASFTTVFLASQGAAARGGRGLPEQFPIFVIQAVLIVGLMLIMVTLPVRIRIERGMGKSTGYIRYWVWICECRSLMCRISSA